MNTYDIFVEVVKQKSFSAAAKKLHRSPSAISKQISLLEQKLNVQLIDRTTRSLSVTEAGRIYYERCLDISARMQDAETELKDLSGEPSGNIYITWPEPVSFSKAVEVLGEFSAVYPKVNVHLNVDHNLLNLTDDKIDIAFRTGALADSQMIAKTLFSIQPIFCATPKLVAKHGFPTTIEALSKFPMINQNNINLQQKARASLPELREIVMCEQHTSNYLSTNLQLTKQNMGATVMFKHMIKQELEDGSLIQLVPELNIPALPVHLLHKKQDYLPKKIRCFIDFFVAAFEQSPTT